MFRLRAGKDRIPLTFVFAFVTVAVLVACGGGADPNSPIATATCGPPPPSAPPSLFLVYPMPGATGVPDDIGIVVVAGVAGTSQDSVTLSSAGGSVPVGAFTAAPSPLPTPHVTPGAQFGPGVAYSAVPVPTLSPATTYTVKNAYPDWADNPPSCTTTVTQTLGTFTTQ
jgi:hypothetical protein